MNEYDVIVVGAGNSGLVSALGMLKKGNKVLLLDDHNKIGGLGIPRTKGRFRFETSPFNLFVDNYHNDSYRIDNLLKKLDIDHELQFSNLTELSRILTIKKDEQDSKDFILPIGKELFIQRLEESVPGCRISIMRFFDYALECKEALEYINGGEVDKSLLKEKYSNYIKVQNLSLSKGFDLIGIPVEVRNILSSWWILLGKSIEDISFVQYAMMFYDAVVYGLKVPFFGTYDISMLLQDEFLEHGGIVKYSSKVSRLIVSDKEVQGVKLTTGDIYYSKCVIVNSSLENIYTNLIDYEYLPKEAMNVINDKKRDRALFRVCLGLNRSVEELGITNYNYLLYNDLDSEKEISNMKSIDNMTQYVTCPNVINENYSPKGTTTLYLSTIYFDDCFGKSISVDNYYRVKEEIAAKLIATFEKTTGVIIKEFIEEIEIITPVGIASYLGSDYGNIYGNDSQQVSHIKGLYTCGGFEGDLFNYHSSYMASYKQVESIVGEKSER